MTKEAGAILSLADEVGAKAGVTAKVARTVIRSLEEVIKEKILNKQPIMMTGVFTVKYKTRKAHIGRNPKTGESIEVPEKVFVHIKPSTVLKKTFKEKAN